MQNHTTARAVAIAAGCLATTGALAILTSDAIATGHWTLEHALMPLVVGLAVVGGHFAPHALREWRLLSALGWAVLFAFATALTIWLSVTRQTANSGATAKDAEAINARRARVEQRLAESREILAACPKGREKDLGVRCGLEQAMIAECGSGSGTRCKGRRDSVDTYRAAIRDHEKELREIGPERQIAPGAATVAEVIVAFAGGDEAAWRHRLALIEPFARSLVFELGALVAFGYGFGGRRSRTIGTVRREADGSAQDKPNGSARIGEKSPNSPNAPKPVQPHGSGPTHKKSFQVRQAEANGSGGTRSKSSHVVQPNGAGHVQRNFVTGRRLSRTEAEADLVTMLALGRTVPSQQALAERWGRSKSTISEWMRAWDAAGLTRRTATGKVKVIAAA